MAGEANDDPVPLMGAGVVFACSASLEVDKTVWWYGPVPLEEPEVVLAPPAPVVVVVVVVAPDVPAAVAAVVVVVTDEEPVVVVVVCGPVRSSRGGERGDQEDGERSDAHGASAPVGDLSSAGDPE